MHDCFWYCIENCEGNYCQCDAYLSINSKEGFNLFKKYEKDVEKAIQPVIKKYEKKYENTCEEIKKKKLRG